MQIDREWERIISKIQQKIGAPSKAETIRWALRFASSHLNLEPKSLEWWHTHHERCRKVPRKTNGKLMTEEEFYEGINF